MVYWNSLVVKVLRNFKLELSSIVLVVGIIATVIAITGVYFPHESPDFLRDLHQDLGGWIYWFVVLGPLFLIGGGWYTIDIVRKRREFNKLIETTSKAKFVRNLDRIEYLAWSLSSDYEEKVWEKKQQFKIKD